MRAAILEAPHRLVVRDVAEPRPASDEVLIAIDLAGICGSDVAFFQGARPMSYPVVLGHEAVGRVMDAGRSQHPPGARVVVEPNIPCRMCLVCQRGLGNICPKKRSLGLNSPGVFAELVAVPAEFVHPIPPEMTAQDAAGIEPLAVAVHAFGVGQAASGDAVAIIGCGTEGLLLTMVAVAMGARVLAADIREDRLVAARRLGATHTLRVPEHEPLEVVAATIARDWSPLVIYEAAGAASALDLALQAVAPGGRVVAVGLDATPVAVVPLKFVRRGLNLVGSLIYDHPADFERSLELVRVGRVRPSALVTAVIDGLEHIPEALQQIAASGQTGKTLLRIGEVVGRNGVYAQPVAATG